MRYVSTSAIAILAATGMAFSASAQDEQADVDALQNDVAAGECELHFAAVDERMGEDPELRAEIPSDVLRDLRRMRNAAITLEQYGESQACQTVVVAIHEILEQPERFAAVEDPEVIEDPDVAEVPEEDEEVAVDPEAEVEDPEVTAAVPQEDEEVAVAPDQPVEEEPGLEQRIELDRERAVGLAEMDAQIRLNQLIGTDVRSADDESIGEVDDVVIGPDGEPQYIVVAHGGFLGIGDDLTPVPFDQVQISPDLDAVFLPITQAELEQAPAVARGDDAWFQDTAWQDQTAQYYQRD